MITTNFSTYNYLIYVTNFKAKNKTPSFEYVNILTDNRYEAHLVGQLRLLRSKLKSKILV